MLTNENARTVEEAYASASNSKNLKVDSHRTGDADIIIAAGWSSSRLGAALLRLHSEWDSTSRRRDLSKEEGEALAAQMQPQHKDESMADRLMRYHQHETALQLSRIKTLPAVRYDVEMQLRIWGIAEPETVAAAVLAWYLSQTCPVCNGTQWQLVPGTNRHSNKVCNGCHGTGKTALPCGEAGRKLANFLDDAVQNARHQIGKRLRNARG